MAREDIIMLSSKEMRRVKIINEVLDKHMTQVAAGEFLSLSDRQVRRIAVRVKNEGDKGFCHRGRGEQSNRSIGDEIKNRIMDLYRKKYAGFGPTLASEKLEETDKIKVSDETLRIWLQEAGIEYKTRKKRSHRQWRQRREHFGELVQIDGSHHDWFEGRGPKCVLMGYVDDATGEVFARFYEYEGTIPAMDSFKRYIELYGIPMSIYLDKHTTYKSTAKLTLEDELKGRERQLSQFERSMDELGVEVIHANSPQAKGRIERLFGTFQDRVLKEMRLSGIKSIDEANSFLETYLPSFNKKFRVLPTKATDLHRPYSGTRSLDQILCIRNGRVLRNDNTIGHNGKLYQIEDDVRAEKVMVEERTDGSMYITYKDKPLRYKEITTRSVREVEPSEPKIRIERKIKPSKDHPWRKHKSCNKGKGAIQPVP
jgi:transposase-like protein